MDREVSDFRGIAIEPGDICATAGSSGRMYPRTVKQLEFPGKPEWWCNVRFEDGFWTTPDRVAVVQKEGTF